MAARANPWLQGRAAGLRLPVRYPENGSSRLSLATSVGGWRDPMAAARGARDGHLVGAPDSDLVGHGVDPGWKGRQGASAASPSGGSLDHDDALAQIEKAKTGSVAPQVATAIKAVEATFPSTEAVREYVLWYPSAFKT